MEQTENTAGTEKGQPKWVPGMKVRIISSHITGHWLDEGSEVYLIQKEDEGWKVTGGWWIDESEAVPVIDPPSAQPSNTELLDRFAMAALTGYASKDSSLLTCQETASEVYNLAEAMMAEREKRMKKT